LARETLKDFLNSKGHATDSITYVRKESPDGLGVDPGTGEPLVDLVNEAQGLLGDYLKFLVDNSSNEFKIKGGNEKASSSNRGDDLVLADLQGAENIFVEQGTVLKSKLNENSNSGKFDASGTDLNTLIDKVGKNFSNHDKLKEIQGRPRSVYGETLTNPNGDENNIVQATQKMFLENNRFANVGNPNKQSFTIKPQSIEQFEKPNKTNNSGTLNLQKKFGVYDQNSEGITDIDKIKQIGASLLLKSSGFSYGSTPGDTEATYEFLEDINNASAQNFNTNSGFTKLNFSNMRSKNAKGFPETDFGDSIRSDRGEFIEPGTEGVDENANSTTTFGTTYNTGFRFQGNTIKLHKIQAAISMIALKNVGSRFWNSFIDKLRQEDRIDLTASTEAFVKEKNSGDVLTYMLGKSRQLGSLQLDNFIFGSLLTNTTYSYGDAVDRGLEILFGSDRDNAEKVANQNLLSQSPGFWIAVARSALKSFDSVYQKYSGEDLNQGLSTKELFAVYKDLIDSNKFIRFFNVLAVMGDISLASTDGVKTDLSDKNFKRSRDVDAIPDTLSIPGKSRKNNGFNKNELSWSSNTTPSMYILPANIIRAASLLNNTVQGENPARGMLGSKLASNTYMGIDVDGSFNRIPNEVVKVLEDQLDSEYVPFYLQDLRTNEIISFHAFLDQLTDSINPNFTSVSAYGRADAVQIYQSTSRSLQVGFTLFATNREDFDSMWYKINKFVTLLYPQYTPGSMVSNGAGSKFYQPFSQVVGASPIVRLRVGDVIKSNYSRFGLARTFGIGDENVNAKINQTPTLGSLVSSVGPLSNLYNGFTNVILKVWLGSFGSPHSIINAAAGAVPSGAGGLAKMLKSSASAGLISAASNILVNGFANPLAVDNIILQLTDPNQSIPGDDQTSKLLSFLADKTLTTGYGVGEFNNGTDIFTFRQMILKPNMINGYFSSETGKKYLLPRRIKVRIMKKGPMSSLSDQAGLPHTIGYLVKVVDPAAPIELSEENNQQHLVVRHADILPDPKELFNNSVIGSALFASDPIAALGDLGLNSLMNEYTLNSGIPNEINDFIRSQYLRDEALFMQPELNPYVRAIETTKGRGLAGVIKGITFNWLDKFPWEVDYNARAPMGVKISFSFDVIHDLPPGLDHSGYNKAPLYNVGEVMRNISGDVYSDNGKSAELKFRNEGGKAARVKGQNNG